jgi:phosphopantothenate synthetase
LLTGLFGNPHAHLKVPLKKFQTIKSELTQKVNVAISGLSAMGISAELLNTKQLIELFYRTYNQEEAIKEKLQDNVESIGVQSQEEQRPNVQQGQTQDAGIPKEPNG